MTRTQQHSTVSQRLQGRFLATLRGGLSPEKVAVSSTISVGRLRRIEAGRVRIPIRDLRELLSLYGVGEDDDRADVALDLARSHKGGRFTNKTFEGVVDLGLELAALEATRIALFAPTTIPLVLRTIGYMRALNDSCNPELGGKKREALLQKQIHDRAKFWESFNGKFRIVLNETVLMRPCEGTTGMVEQIEDLQRRAGGSMELQIMPHEMTSALAATSEFALLTHPGPDGSPLTTVWRPLGPLHALQEDADDVTRMSDRFDRISADASGLRESGEVLAKYAAHYALSAGIGQAARRGDAVAGAVTSWTR